MSDGVVFNIQRFSTDDGDGIRTCVFLKGCPLRCRWCHNGEGLSPLPEIAHYAQNCIGCGACVSVCPRSAIALRGGKAVIERSRCIACGRCAEVCCTGTLVRVGKTMTVDEVMDTVRRDLIFYGERGGLTITGGEPIAQPAFTLALAKTAKKEGISVFVETSGFGKQADFLALVPYCDVFLFDCKASVEEHKALTGVEATDIERNLDAICRAGARVRLRCPIVGGANLCDKFIERIGELAARYEAIESVQLMPYHKTGALKSKTLGKDAQRIFETPSLQTLEEIAQRIERTCGKKVIF